MEKLINDCIKLGFGMMRLPRISRNGMEVIDVERTADMVDAFLAAGGKYFDTAFVYEGSEEATRKALVERHPRDSILPQRSTPRILPRRMRRRLKTSSK